MAVDPFFHVMHIRALSNGVEEEKMWVKYGMKLYDSACGADQTFKFIEAVKMLKLV